MAKLQHGDPNTEEPQPGTDPPTEEEEESLDRTIEDSFPQVILRRRYPIRMKMKVRPD